MLTLTRTTIQGKILPQYLLGIDLGASSLKATVIGETGKLVGEASQPLSTSMPHPGWAEQNTAEWYAALCSAVPAALAGAGLSAEAISGIGITAGAHIPVLTDASGAVLRPAILWSDQRAAAQASALHEAAGAEIIARSLNRVNPTWTMAMLAWLRENESGVAARAKRLYLAKDYLRFCLTGTWQTDFSDAIGALLADNATKNWSPELCGLVGWDVSKLPPILKPTDIVGSVTSQAAAHTGLAAGTPVVCGANDTTTELFGLGAIAPGMGAMKLATAGVLYLATQGPSVHPPISCYPHIIDGMFYTAMGTNSCASAHRWLRDIMFADGGFEAMDEATSSVAPGAEGLLFHPYLQGERAPYWDPLLRGDFIGLTITHGKAHFARALYEGIAFSMRDLLEAARDASLHFGAVRIAGGGAQSTAWRQIIADVTGLTIERTECTDAAFGAALLAGIGTGVFATPGQAVAKCVHVTDVTKPGAAAHDFYSRLFKIYKEAQAALANINHRLHF